MEYDKIILEMLDRIKTLEGKVDSLNTVEEQKNVQTEYPHIKPSKKYRFLSGFLESSGNKSVQMTFSEIEKTVGFKLPKSAREYRAFWTNTTTHSIAHGWLSVGYKTVDIDLDSETVVFEKY